MNNNKIDSFPILVEPFHVDFRGQLFMGVLCNHLLNAAGKHSGKRGWGITDLMQDHHTWVLSRIVVEMERMPMAGETITLSTWVESAIRLFTYRNFAIHDAQGKAIGYARSIWAMIDTQTRKPADLLTFRDGELLQWACTEEEAPCPIAGFERMKIKDAAEARKVDTHYSDVDINGHINSVKYIEHIIDLFDKDTLKPGIRRLDIAYKTEAYWGDTLTLLAQQETDESTLVEVRKPGGDVAVQARITLNKK